MSLLFYKGMRHNSVMCRILIFLNQLKWVGFVLIFLLLPIMEIGVGETDISSLQAQSNSASRIPIPNLNFNVNEAKTPRETSLSLMILFLVTILSLAPAIVMSVTSFTKIVIVLDFVRRALSLQNLPPNQVMMGLALFMTFFIMAPTLGEINQTSLQPFMEGKIDTNTFLIRQWFP
jgi:flagellar biosynthetic protein FliP